MKVRVPAPVKDPEVAQWKEVPPTEMTTIDDEDVFLDGPVTRRVAVIDLDPTTNALRPGTKFIPPKKLTDEGTYDVPNLDALDDPRLIQTATFGGVMKTVGMFEDADALGRRVTWGFDGPQLLVVPLAGEWANAYYERASRSLQFFYIPSNQHTIRTCQSQDIIAHETTHAVIDGVAPDLFDAATPESLALHEALADVATLVMAFRSRPLATAVLAQTGNSIVHSNAFSGIAEQLGSALRAEGRPLRELNNERAMSDRGLDRAEPHALSEVLSGALYKLMVAIHEDVKGETHDVVSDQVLLSAERASQSRASSDDGGSPTAARSTPLRDLFIATERFKRTVFRALDYLPPGDATFVDFARAVLAADQAAHPESGEQRKWLSREFVKRGIAERAGDLLVSTDFEARELKGVDLDDLLRSDWRAYGFVDSARKLLHLPARLPFEVRPRLRTQKAVYHREGRGVVDELLLKVTWNETESSSVGGGLPRRRRVARGTTLAIDWITKRVRAVVTTARDARQSERRDAFVAALADEGRLLVGDEFPAGRRKPRGFVHGDVVGGALKLRGAGRALHLFGEASP